MSDTDTVEKNPKDSKDRKKRYIYLKPEHHELVTKVADNIGMKIYLLEGLIFEEGLKSGKFAEYKKLAGIK